MSRNRFSDCGATDEEVLESLQEEFDEMQRTARQYAARCRELEAALRKEMQRYISLADRQAKRGKNQAADELWEKADEIKKILDGSTSDRGAKDG